jgi:hypothetical protein
LRDLLAQYRDPHLKHTTIKTQKSAFQIFYHGTKLQASQNIFAGILNEPFLKYGQYPRQNPM